LSYANCNIYYVIYYAKILCYQDDSLNYNPWFQTAILNTIIKSVCFTRIQLVFINYQFQYQDNHLGFTQSLTTSNYRFTLMLFNLIIYCNSILRLFKVKVDFRLIYALSTLDNWRWLRQITHTNKTQEYFLINLRIHSTQTVVLELSRSSQLQYNPHGDKLIVSHHRQLTWHIWITRICFNISLIFKNSSTKKFIISAEVW
jgi:hypothetical protein